MGGKKKNIIYSAYHEYGKRLERLEKDTKLTVNNLNTTCEICNTKKNNEGLYLEFLNVFICKRCLLETIEMLNQLK